MLVAGEGFLTSNWITYLVFLGSCFNLNLKVVYTGKIFHLMGKHPEQSTTEEMLLSIRMKVFYTMNIISSGKNMYSPTSEQMISWCSSYPEVQIPSFSLSLRERILAYSASQKTILTATSITIEIQCFCMHSKTTLKTCEETPWNSL